jgi:outer membrane lipoprotein-sorting protein
MTRTTKPEPIRDEELGAALLELEVPEHRPGFYAELEERLAVAGRASSARRPRARTRRARTRWALRVAVVAAAAAILVVAIGIPATERTGPDVATAAEVKAKVRTALATIESLAGTVITDGPQKGDEERWEFLMTADGDFRVRGPSEEELVTYDASTGTAYSAQRSASVESSRLFYTVQTGIAPGRPDQSPPAWVLPDEFGAFVQVLLAAEDPRVREVAYEGRPAWTVVVDAVPNAIVPEFSGDAFEITVDQESGMPVRVLETKSGAFLGEIRIEGLVVNAEVPPDAFRQEFPAGAEVMRSDDGFRRVTLDEVATVVGYPPLVPGWVPQGYELAEVAVARRAGPTGTEAANPLSEMVVSLSYRRGLDQFLVTTRLTRPPHGLAPEEGGPPVEELWGDPLATGEGFRDEPELIVLRGGALDGEDAELVIVPRGIPHVWALTDDLVVTVGGDLSRAELVRVAESLERR